MRLYCACAMLYCPRARVRVNNKRGAGHHPVRLQRQGELSSEHHTQNPVYLWGARGLGTLPAVQLVWKKNNVVIYLNVFSSAVIGFYGYFGSAHCLRARSSGPGAEASLETGASTGAASGCWDTARQGWAYTSILLMWSLIMQRVC